MLEQTLREIGLTDWQSKVYLALMHLGDSTRTDIVKHSQIAGSKVYDVLEKLKQKGLVTIYTKNKVKHFKAVNPKQILNYIEDKQLRLMDMKKSTKNILPGLMSLFNSSSKDEEVELFEGLKGLQAIFTEQINTMKRGDICFVIGGTRDPDEEVIQSFFEKIHILREEKGIKTKMLMNYWQKNSLSKRYTQKKYPSTTTRYIKHSAPVAINIYKDRTIIIIFGRSITSIYIKSDEVAASFLEYFKLLWSASIA